MTPDVWIRSFGDNYIYLLSQGDRACVIDPGAAEPVQRLLSDRHSGLALILNTHHHFDHTGGNATLRRDTGCEVVSGSPRTPQVSRLVTDGDTVPFGDYEFRVIATPGHTRDSVCYYLPGSPGLLFTGDTLFVSGCGRLQEGIAEELFASLQKLAALPDDTRIYCGHEYTQENLSFAFTLMATDHALIRRRAEMGALRSAGKPTVPTTLGEEKRFNPFLRAADADAFAALRKKKDQF